MKDDVIVFLGTWREDRIGFVCQDDKGVLLCYWGTNLWLDWRHSKIKGRLISRGYNKDMA